MKNNTTRILIISICAGLCLTGPNPALADQDASRHKYSRQGQAALEQADFSSAAYYFLGALVLDPADELARQYLQDPRLIESFSGADQRQIVNGLLEMANFMQFLLSRVQFYQDQNQDGISRLRSWTGQGGLSGSELDQIEKKITVPALAGSEQLELPDLVSTAELPVLDLIRAAMQRQKKQLVFALAEQRNINREIKALQIKTSHARRAEAGGAAPAAAAALVTPDTPAALTEELRQKEQRIAEQDRSIQEIRQQLGGVSQKFDILEQQLQRTEEKVTEMTRKIAGMSLEIYEKDNLLANRANQIDDLEFQLRDAQERIKLIQQLIAEKDQRILDMEAAQAATPAPVAEITASADDANAALAEDAQMHVAALNAKYEALRAVLAEKEQQITALRQELDQTPAPRPARQSGNDPQVSQLMEIITIYKDRLGETCRLLKERDERLLKMEDQLRAVEGLINRSVPAGPSASTRPDDGSSPFDYPAPHELSVRDKVPLNQLGVLERVKQESSAAATRMLMSPGIPTLNP